MPFTSMLPVVGMLSSERSKYQFAAAGQWSLLCWSSSLSMHISGQGGGGGEVVGGQIRELGLGGWPGVEGGTGGQR